jgi:hypothetical protein
LKADIASPRSDEYERSLNYVAVGEKASKNRRRILDAGYWILVRSKSNSYLIKYLCKFKIVALGTKPLTSIKDLASRIRYLIP